MSADQGDQLGIHWIGVFHHLAVGVPKNVAKAIEYLTKSSKTGNV
jgi:TPR repeat protein